MVDIKKIKAPKERRYGSPCYHEVQAFLNCLKTNDYDDSKCRGEIQAMTRCSDALLAKAKENKGRHKVTTNYHLQRLAQAVLNKKK
ncbi:Coiled-coil-helix-coiled-coil-helix domain-containing protein 1 [Hondaea fermentalgiana]|uniref:Coiled-coil-helix-coiled-coil-helix domain-containing protein 1 n=1 Tax=Hondaea fermentalgiana TaxID=2315210 RepID=A0A2R5G4X9_9STRA|nr:Coiled-coil-helix-coiled-coil-helix domain-containing protein 1 [Hondaea fermentalgiana]|eukprot:GBG26077.1 Coiled-coil-helix-coiled-coil-helix domain-containing protein 1 [Hondaea fermentalgiana]